MSLKRIPSDIQKKLSATSYVNSFNKAIEELVYNSLDASSTSIAIRVFIEESTIQVIDNGYGISQNDFKNLGHRYMTSKHIMHGDTTHTYGYKGLSLVSIIDISKRVKITSRFKESNETMVKVFVEGKEQDIANTSTRPSKGTTVDISGFLYNLHIQKKSMNPTLEISLVKCFLEKMSLVHFNTSISLRDDSKNEIIFKINKNRDIYKTLSTLFDIEYKEIQELKVEKNDYKIHGFVEKVNSSYKKYHLIYVNERCITKSRLHNQINKSLRSFTNIQNTKRRKDNFNVEKITIKNVPFYFIFITCPRDVYEIITACEETNIEFKRWEKIDLLLEKFIHFFKGDFKTKSNDHKKNPVVKNNDTRKRVGEIIQKILGNDPKKSKRSQILLGIKGKNAKRKHINKQKDDLTIKKIVDKKLKLNIHKKNEEKGNNTNENIPHKILKEQDISNDIQATVLSSEVKENQYTNTKQNKEHNYHKIENHYHDTNVVAKNEIKCNNNLTASKGPLSTKLENTNTLIKKYNLFWKEVKHLIDAKKYYNNLRYHNENKNTNIWFHHSDYSMKRQKKIMENGALKYFHPHYNTKNIKTSYDLVKSILSDKQIPHFELKNAKCQTKRLRTKYEKKRKDTGWETYENKLTYESHKYTKVRLSKNLNKNCKYNLCGNLSNTNTNILHKLPLHPKNNKCNNNNENGFSALKNSKEKPNVNYFINKTIFQSTLYTIESLENQYHLEPIKESTNTNLLNLESHNNDSIYPATNIRETRHSVSMYSSIDRFNFSTYDQHKTYTIYLSNSSSHHCKQSNIVANDQNHDSFKNTHNTVFVSASDSINGSPTFIDPTNIVDTMLQSSNLRNDEITDFYLINESVNEILSDSNYNHNSNQREGSFIAHPSDSRKENNDIEVTEELIEVNNDENLKNNTLADVIVEHKVSEIISNNLKETDIAVIDTENFTLNGRYSFVPKGMSQITNKKLPKGNALNFEKDIFEDAIYRNFVNNIQIYSEVLEPNVQNIMETKNNINFDPGISNNNNGLLFDAVALSDSQVLGQLDYKFITSKINGKQSDTETFAEFLVLFDQHAVDERIKLEKNMLDYFNGSKWFSVALEALPLQLPRECITILHNNKEKFTRFGLDWTYENNLLCIKAIPKAILGKNSRQSEVIVRSVKYLITEQVEAIKSLKGNVCLYPKSIMDLVLSEACRYAIKFGDKLSLNECKNMLNALSTCKLPFQCAHGRPVMAVIMEIPRKDTYEYKIDADKVKKFLKNH